MVSNLLMTRPGRKTSGDGVARRTFETKMMMMRWTEYITTVNLDRITHMRAYEGYCSSPGRLVVFEHY